MYKFELLKKAYMFLFLVQTNRPQESLQNFEND